MKINNVQGELPLNCKSCVFLDQSAQLLFEFCYSDIYTQGAVRLKHIRVGGCFCRLFQTNVCNLSYLKSNPFFFYVCFHCVSLECVCLVCSRGSSTCAVSQAYVQLTTQLQLMDGHLAMKVEGWLKGTSQTQVTNSDSFKANEIFHRTS